MKYLGIDYGNRKVGLAMGDDEVGIATPLEVMENGDDFLERLAELIRKEDVDALVVGVPQQEQGEVTKEFIQAIEARVQKPVHTVDESYSSRESQRIQEENGSNVPEDALAAMLILQSYLDELVRR